MGETASLVTSIIEKLKEPVLKEAKLLFGVANKVDSVREKLEWIKAFLTDAETRDNQNEIFKLGMQKLRDVAYRIEDAIDIYVVQIKGGRVFCDLIKKAIALHKLGVELNDIRETLEEIKKDKEMFQTNDGGAHPMRLLGSTLPFQNLEENTVGLEDDTRAIVSKLLDLQGPALKIISIVGPGGLGKTTLAHKVFNSADVEQNFDMQIWLSVSQEFDRIGILKKILRKIHKAKEEEEDEDEMYFIAKIQSSLKKKRFLIVLDDAWPETPLPVIGTLCPSGNEMGLGRVLITTRDLNVAQKAKSEPYNLELLTEEESKTLLFQTAFGREEPPQGLEDVVTEIAKGCGGLPLALVVTGGSLYMKYNYLDWRKVADSEVWQGSECMNVLATSYDNMPIILKACFMYLASFPDDYVIDAKSLIRTWVAENLVIDEETAEQCLQELAQRCLIIVRRTSFDGSVNSFCVHDLLLALAIKKAEEQKFLSISRKQNGDQIVFNNARRASLQSCSFGQRNNHSLNAKKVRINYNKKLRSLLVFSGSLPDDLSGFKLLKVIKVHHCDIRFSQLEKCCKELIHLRHLEFRKCKIQNGKIPESIGLLKNLLTLDCSDTSIRNLPHSMWRIPTLRHVLCDQFVDLPQSANLPNLKTLRGVRPFNPCNYQFPNLRHLYLEYKGPWVATLLKELDQLVSLEISNLVVANVVGFPPFLDGVVDMSAFPFYEKLQSLILWGGQYPEFVLRAHHVPQCLARLELWNVIFYEDPMREVEKLKKLVILNLHCCKYCPSNYRPILTTLTSSAGGFPQLQHLLLFWTFDRVEEFIVAPGAMPMLKKLTMRGFEGMKDIPELQHLKMLRQFEWEGPPCSELEIKALLDKNQHKLKHIPSVTIRSRRKK